MCVSVHVKKQSPLPYFMDCFWYEKTFTCPKGTGVVTLGLVVCGAKSGNVWWLQVWGYVVSCLLTFLGSKGFWGP